MAEISCAKCQWFKPYAERIRDMTTGEIAGLCVIRSPNPAWPRVIATDWCGEHAPFKRSSPPPREGSA
jgi:hypothetical protein